MSALILVAALIVVTTGLCAWALRTVANHPRRPVPGEGDEVHEVQFLSGAGLPFISTYVTSPPRRRPRPRPNRARTNRRR